MTGEIGLDTVRMAPVRDDLLLNGRVNFNPERVAQVYALYSGYVIDTRAEIGDYVNKGAVLAVVKSDEVADMVKQCTEAEERVRVATREVDAKRQLATGGLSSERDVMEAEQELKVAEAERKRMAELYALHSISQEATYTVKSPTSGFVVGKAATRGRLLRPDNGEALFVIANLDDVWVCADVYEGDICKIEKGADVKITPLAYKEKEFVGRVDHMDHMLNADSKTMGIYVSLANPNELLKPGMFANVWVATGGVGQKLPVVSSQSVVFDGGKEYVVVLDGGSYQIREVALHGENGGLTYLEKGLAEGDVVVDQGALLVYNALK